MRNSSQRELRDMRSIKEIVKDYTPERLQKICHIDADELRKAAIMYAKADKAPIIYCLGVTEHSTGTEGVMSMSNMALLVGKLGREGCGSTHFVVPEQCTGRL